MGTDSPEMIKTQFLQHDAIQLAYALTTHRAASIGIRALGVKGLVADFHGLRPARTPADIDVLVEPAGFEEFLAVLAGDGWEPRPRGEVVGNDDHSITLINPTWPCDIDVHSFIPGFFAAPDLAFDLVWADRVTLNFANRQCPSAGFSSSILIQALHSIRSPTGNPRHARELQSLLDRLASNLSDDARTHLLSLALATGAAHGLGGRLAPLGIPLDTLDDVPEDQRADVLLWIKQRRSGGDAGLHWANEVSQTTWYRRPRLLFRILWPTEADFRVRRLDVAPGRIAAIRGRLGRLGRGLLQLPTLLRAKTIKDLHLEDSD